MSSGETQWFWVYSMFLEFMTQASQTAVCHALTFTECALSN